MITHPFFWLALVSAVLVHRDAARRHAAHPLAWALAVFLLWIVALPAYLWHRSAKPR